MSKTTYYGKEKRSEKLSRNDQLELMFDLVNSFRFVNSPSETIDFLQDLLTAKEIKNLSKRLRIAKLLLSGKKQEEIVKSLHVSFASVSKVSIWLGSGGQGFKNVIAKLPLKYKIPENLPPIPIEFQLPKVISGLYQYSKATSQNKMLEKFLEGVGGKEYSDRKFRENLNEEFGTRSLHKKQK
jgi:uncharacterized protein YerC